MKTHFLSLALATCLGFPAWCSDRAPVRPVNLNSATATELMQLPRIGAKTAERIIAFRKQHGSFQRPEELLNVKGIGEKSFARLKPHLVVASNTKPTGAAKAAARIPEEK